MRISFVFLTLLFIFVFSASARGDYTHSILLIRSPYADENLRIILEISDSQILKAFQELIGLATELRKPYPAFSPLNRFELKTSAEKSAVYDFVPYRNGEKILFWHNNVMNSVSVMHVKEWCRVSDVSFEKHFKLPATD